MGKKGDKMIRLELTSTMTGKKLFLTGETFAVAKQKDETMIQNGMNNNGGFKVKEEYETVVGMIRKQCEPAAPYGKRNRSYYIKESS
jgi:hypothetical protein